MSGNGPVTVVGRGDHAVRATVHVPSALHGRRLLLVLHGTDRDDEACLAAFTGLADRAGAALVVPRFPVDLGPRRADVDAYKWLAVDGFRYDAVLLELLDTVRTTVGLRPAPLVAWGFSGGAQFVHRLALVHPQQVRALGLGAPGRPTRLDVSLPWWRGLAGTRQLFGQAVDPDALHHVAVHVAVGDGDVAPLPAWPEEPGKTTTRVERLHRWVDELRCAGVDVRFDVVPGVGHELLPLAAAAQPFLQAQLDAIRA